MYYIVKERNCTFRSFILWVSYGYPMDILWDDKDINPILSIDGVYTILTSIPKALSLEIMPVGIAWSVMMQSSSLALAMCT